MPFNDRLVFNRIGSLTSPPPDAVHDRSTLRISNTGSGPLRITGLNVTGPFTLVNPPALPATIAAGGQLDVTVRFTASSGSVSTGQLDDRERRSGDSVAERPARRGLAEPVPEGGNEPTLKMLVNDVFGYTSPLTYSGQTLNRAGRIETAGEEILSPYWSRVDTTKPVTVRQLAAFHTQGNTATVFWHQRGSSTTTPIFTHAGSRRPVDPAAAEREPQPAARAGTFSPNGLFGFKIDPEWSVRREQRSDRRSERRLPGPCGHHVRFWPALDRNGNWIPNTYLMAMDYSGINYDYNDNVYLVGNVKPEGTGPILQRLDVAGSANYTDTLNRIWKPDTGLFSPSTAIAEGANVTPSRSRTRATTRSSRPIAAMSVRCRSISAASATRYRSGARAGSTSGSTSPSGRARTTPIGKRVFDISAEGNLLVDNFDIFARTGAINTAYQLPLDNIAVNDGTLNLLFKPESDYASIAGIEVFCRVGC